MKSFTKCGLILVLGVLFSSLMMYKRIFDIKISNAENVSNNVHYMSKNNSDVITTVGDNKCTGLEFGEKCIFITHPYIRTSLLVGVLSGYKNLEKKALCSRYVEIISWKLVVSFYYRLTM